MNWYKRLIWPQLRKLDAEKAHNWTLIGLEGAQSTMLGRACLDHVCGETPHEPITCFGLTFPNVIGMAAGFDKDVRVANGLAHLGFGHVEVGTLTPRPQRGNPKPRMFRYPDEGAVLNRMGFPNGGVRAAVPRLKQIKESGLANNCILGVSLGKQKETALDEAVNDYIHVMRHVYPYADYLAVNVSSPNTPGLRQLQGKAFVDDLLGRLNAERTTLTEATGAHKPLLIKIAPDLTWDEIGDIVDAAESHNIDGIIATNTTIGHSKSEQGGYSGVPLGEKSNEVIRYIKSISELPIIGVGGVRSADDVRAKLDAGATLVQLYTGLVYEGPGMIGRMLREVESKKPYR